jgi:glucokinase
MPGRRIIGVDMGGTKLLAGVLDGELGVHHRTQRAIGGLSQPRLLETVTEAVQELREGPSGAAVEAVGFGIPSLLDSRSGRSAYSVHLPLQDLPFADLMAERLGLPAFADNDGNMAALAEHRAGAAAGSENAIVLTIGTGIGGGLILGGELYRGAIGAGGELGHVVIDLDGPLCQGNCPSRGCVEALASGPALAREAARIAAERPDSALGLALRGGREPAGPLVSELAHDGDRAALDALELIGSRLGVAIASFVNIFNPEVVVIGGGVIGAGEFLLGPARAEIARRALPPSREIVEIRAAHFGVEAGMIGAGALALDALAAREGRR